MIGKNEMEFTPILQQQQQQQQLPRDGSVFNRYNDFFLTCNLDFEFYSFFYSLTGLVLTVQRHYTTRMRFDRTDVRLRTADQQIVAIYAYGEIHAGRLETVPVNQVKIFIKFFSFKISFFFLFPSIDCHL
jgi:hypothetical protein